MSALALFAAVGLAHADEPPNRWYRELTLSGFVSPSFGVVVRGAAAPEDALELGMTGSRAGLSVQGDVADRWSYRVYLRVGADTFSAVTSVRTVDEDNDGRVDGVSTTTQEAVRDIVRETSVTWRAVDALAFQVGRLPIPFTSAAQSPDTALLFPERASPTSVFLADDDLGAVLAVDVADRLLVNAGLFNGTGVGASSSSTRGVLYLARVDVHPFGAFAFDETSPLRSDLRVGLGAGVAWHPYQAFDGAGSPSVVVSDLRGAGSVRLSVAGVSLAAEGLFRNQVDTLTARPTQAIGAYGQAGWYLPLGVEPIGRLGTTVEDRAFDPRRTRWADAGVNLYPVALRDRAARGADAVKITLQAQAENRVTEGEVARGGSAQVQVRF